MKSQRMPSNLTKNGKGQKLWKDLTERVEFTDVELRTLENACYTVDRIAKERRAIGDNLIVAGSQGQDVAHPLLVHLRADEKHLAELLARLDIPDESDGSGSAGQRSAQMRQVAANRWATAYGG
ncbi:MAG: hypothetical protein SO360_01860 [Bifidobacterium tsurumiense]|uniref:hypothetical protein n=1 Tax=Bifidobacterium tsurumiense TaxID=356829 RepID=UPI002A83CA25|nr:hypothetical protein [Bifidobacterium tsurumiense]MDY4677598.1 hypothetical protein [Bifidobacterium tsurumiense]